MAVKTEPGDARVPAQAAKPLKAKQVDDSKEARQKAKKAMWDFRKATAWQVHRWPLAKRIVEDRTKLHLPRSYQAKAGEDVKNVWPGADLNQIVHQHYLQLLNAEKASEESANFVAEQDIVARRHEFLGPDPRVAGYFFDVEGEIHVKWWDNFLQVQWMDRSTWTFDVLLSEDGKWVEKED